MEAYKKESCGDYLMVEYFPGMATVTVLDHWHDQAASFNISIKDWRAMNVAVEAAHNGEHHDQER